MKANGHEGNTMEKERKLKQMETSMKGIGLMTCVKGMVYLLIKMETNMKVIGREERNMGKERKLI
jgi:hypothetical protein